MQMDAHNTTDETRALFDHVDVDELTDALTGRAGGLRPSKPTTHDELTQYVWRMCRFHSGHDPSMPVTASWDLQAFLDEQGIEARVSGITDDAGKEITGALDELCDVILVELGEDPYGAAKRWQGLLY